MAGAIGAVAMRPKCEGPTVSTAAAATPRAMTTTTPDAIAIASFATPAIAAAGRNVFAFASLPRPQRTALRHEIEPHSATVVTPPQIAPPDPPRNTDPAYRYLGAFGPAEYPIAVVKLGADVVNVPLRKP